MKQYCKFKKAFGLNDLGKIDFPNKISSVKISRIKNYEKMGGCPFCFPHGIETTNSTLSKYTKNWKKYRMNQWK